MSSYYVYSRFASRRTHFFLSLPIRIYDRLKRFYLTFELALYYNIRNLPENTA